MGEEAKPAPLGFMEETEGAPAGAQGLMISLKKLSGRKGEREGIVRPDASAPVKPARDVWNVVMETISVGQEPVFALSFQRKGTSVYYLHRHFRSRQEADRETLRLHRDLSLERTDFEVKYALDAWN